MGPQNDNYFSERSEGSRRPRPSGEHILSSTAGWMLTQALIFAPLAMGSIPPLARAVLNAWLLIAAALWIFGHVANGSRPRVSPILLAAGAALLALGWFATLNAHGAWSSHLQRIVAIRPVFPFAPGSDERMVSVLAMTQFTAMFATLLVVSDLAHHAVWRTRFLTSLAVAGAAVSLLGLAQLAGVSTPISAAMDPHEGAYFSSFNYHANAGAYLNLVLPPLIALAAAAFVSRSLKPQRYPLLAAPALVLVAVFANTSRGAQGIALILVIVMAAFTIAYLRAAFSELTIPRGFRTPALALAAVIVVGLTFLMAGQEAKWRRLPSQLTDDSARWRVWRLTLPMARRAGAMGHGPGTFKLLLTRSQDLGSAFYYHWIVQPHIPGGRVSMWSMAHQDYLQTWVEFGWLGSVLIALVVFGGLIQGIRRAREGTDGSSRAEDFAWIGVVVALAGVLAHAAFDFPLQVPSLQLTTAVLLGICWSVRSSRRGRSTTRRKRS